MQTMGYSKDFKDKVIEIMTRDKMSVRKTAQHFSVSTRTIQLWQKSTEQKPIPGRPAKIIEAQILADIEKYPDDYQYERAERLGVSTHAVFNAYIKQEYHVKKTLTPPKSDAR
ncbi:IS630 transposase-related protein [Acinetobacter sp. YZS-X1-1]|uniref:IS630 transposase-related protein n=1 Tax=Acinetobacter sp. YZS-X1-1 TaxID=1501691 RepID=UPI001D0D44BE|nr:IS630 transposase-related protein [Acinetobacter sp. YZS-X1-1]